MLILNGRKIERTSSGFRCGAIFSSKLSSIIKSENFDDESVEPSNEWGVEDPDSLLWLSPERSKINFKFLKFKVDAHSGYYLTKVESEYYLFEYSGYIVLGEDKRVGIYNSIEDVEAALLDSGYVLDISDDDKKYLEG